MRCFQWIAICLLVFTKLVAAQSPGQPRGQNPEESWENLEMLPVGGKIQEVVWQ